MRTNEEVDALLDKLESLERRVQQLENMQPYPPVTPGPFGTEIICPVCKVDLEKCTGYVCNHPNCPSKVVCDVTESMG